MNLPFKPRLYPLVFGPRIMLEPGEARTVVTAPAHMEFWPNRLVMVAHVQLSLFARAWAWILRCLRIRYIERPHGIVMSALLVNGKSQLVHPSELPIELFSVEQKDMGLSLDPVALGEHLSITVKNRGKRRVSFSAIAFAVGGTLSDAALRANDSRLAVS